MTHTKGKWQAYNSTGKNGRILKTWHVQAVNPLSTDMHGTAKICTLDDTMGEAYNNAKLITAAPELLKALQAIEFVLNGDIENHKNGLCADDRYAAVRLRDIVEPALNLLK